MIIQDLHAHTYFSFCSQDKPEKVVETAIAGGIQMLGICDHSYGVGCARKEFCYDKGNNLSADYGLTLQRYYDHMSLIREKYRNRIKILCGIEASTLLGRDDYALPNNVDVSFFDFCLVENLDEIHRSTAKGDIFTFAKITAGSSGTGAGYSGNDHIFSLKKCYKKRIFQDFQGYTPDYNGNCDFCAGNFPGFRNFQSYEGEAESNGGYFP